MKANVPNSTSPLVPLSQATFLSLNQGQDISQAELQGKISKDGQYAWCFAGPALEVIDTRNGERTAAWCFGYALRDQKAIITSVAEYPARNGSLKLLVGVVMSSQLSMLCIFDVSRSKVIKAIIVPEMITCIEPIEAGFQGVECVFSEQLQCFAGIVALGLKTGSVFLLDLCEDNLAMSDEVRPSQLSMITPRTVDIAARRKAAILHGEHLCLFLDSDCHKRGSFVYRVPDGSISKKFSSDYAFISKLQFVRHIGCLAVGFNFGCFQLWRLNSPVLEYSSPVEDQLAPVSDFVYQEAENDPKNFVYMWVCRGPVRYDMREGDCSSLSLYQFGFNKKDHIDSYGHMYQDLATVIHRFEHALAVDPFNVEDVAMSGSRLVSCKVISSDASSKSLHDSEDSFEGSDFSMCMFVWEAFPEDGQPHSVSYLAIFDMNRWYHAQMPGAIRQHSGKSECSFFAFYNLEDVLLSANTSSMLACNINPMDVVRFTSSSYPAPEQYYNPSALSFDIYSLLKNGTVCTEILGVQRQCLSDLFKLGSMAIVEPATLYDRCYHCGLLQKGHEQPSKGTPVTVQREALLNMALEFAMISVMSVCITQWAEGELTQKGCNRRFLLQWMWKRAVQLKENIDKLCIPFFNCSSSAVDEQTLQLLHSHCNQLSHLASLFQLLQTEAGPTTEQGQRDLVSKSSVVTLLLQFTQVVQWFLTVGLLPENDEQSQPPENQYVYPTTSIVQSFNLRRIELRRLHPDSIFHDLLMIDGMVARIGEEARQLWMKGSGDGFYPPPSIHALLSMYLLEDVPLMLKHSIVAYFILDLISLQEDKVRDNDLADCWQLFCETFAIPLGLTRLIQGMWQLDHKDNDEALNTLLDPLISREFEQWHHRRILKAFLYQNHPHLALKYLYIRRPTIILPEDVKLKLTILLANGCIAEAYEYQQSCHDQINSTDLLSHFFLGCQQTQNLDRLLQLPLNSREEHALIKHLKNCDTDSAFAQELLVMHYLQRGKIIEAVKLNESLVSDIDLVRSQRAIARNAIIEGYTAVLPDVQQKFTYVSSASLLQSSKKQIVVRPKPLSTIVNKNRGARIVSQASLINAVLEKVAETKTIEEEDELESNYRESESVIYASVIHDGEDIPKSFTPQKLAFGLSPVKTFSKRYEFGVKTKLYVSAEAKSLLCTPPVRRRPPSRTPHSIKPIHMATPQSILKVRQINQCPPSAKKDKEYPVRGKRMTEIITSDMPMATPPSVKTAPSFQMLKATATDASPMLTTPDRKQIRFSVPSAEESVISASTTAAEVESSDSDVSDVVVSPEEVFAEDEDVDMESSDEISSGESVLGAGGDTLEQSLSKPDQLDSLKHELSVQNDQKSSSQSFLGRIFSFGTATDSIVKSSVEKQDFPSEGQIEAEASFLDATKDSASSESEDDENEDVVLMEVNENFDEHYRIKDKFISEEIQQLVPSSPMTPKVKQMTIPSSEDLLVDIEEPSFINLTFDEPDRDHSRQESPLSSGSFMMQLRSGNKDSPEGNQTRDRSPDEFITYSNDEKPEAKHDFTFATPVAVETDKNMIDNINVTPARPFVFSPPLTRSRQRHQRRSDESQEPKPDFRLPSPPRNPGSRIPVKKIDLSPPAPDELQSKKRPLRAKKQKIPITPLTDAVDDSDVKLITPPDVRKSPRRKLQDKKAASGYRMVLRNRTSQKVTSRPLSYERTRTK